MSLTRAQQQATITEFKQNLQLSGLTTTTIAHDLHTDPDTIVALTQLRTQAIENPWILRNYLLQQISAAGKQPVPFTALVGDYHDYWFLNAKKIERGVL
ncbi:DUF2316 family protein [Loigolactobacillus binensis]|uniref:DUF2316 family protein n=1 Tax=Loigolactobacillus binensis TaxID=2559922 RepID=A0ABW3EC30_9LACO|nr:DUF2316 family protein [Loigolactobacillus binensis]